MIRLLSNMLVKYTNGRTILAFLGLMLLFAMVLVPTIQGKLEAASGGSGPIDLLFSYTPEKAFSMIESYGDEGRSTYRVFAMTGDVIYPVVYSILFSLLITWLFQRGFAPGSKLQLLNTIPLGAWLFDWLENINIVILLSIYPSSSALVATLASTCTTVKWSLGGVGMLLVLTGFAMALKNRFVRQ